MTWCPMSPVCSPLREECIMVGSRVRMAERLGGQELGASEHVYQERPSPMSPGPAPRKVFLHWAFQIREECLACRRAAAVFNMSYFGKFYLLGVDARKAADWLFSADVNRPPGTGPRVGKIHSSPTLVSDVHSLGHRQGTYCSSPGSAQSVIWTSMSCHHSSSISFLSVSSFPFLHLVFLCLQKDTWP